MSEAGAWLSWGPGAIEFVAALVIVGYALHAWRLLISTPGSGEARIAAARLAVADGAILGLSLKLAATLLKALALHSWTAILAFSAILALRTLLKRSFAWERSRLTNASWLRLPRTNRLQQIPAR